ncbi:phage major capsid protein [Pseudonocardia alni]|uniref:phage major capsid protein n=1 Tax=Pseudonocardia alni TaxID=33907 RepID=UPI0033CA244C
MARNTMEAWIPEEYGSEVIQRVQQVSAVERWASPVPMNSQTKSVPRSAGVGVSMVSKGSAYSEDESVNDEVVLRVQKFGKAIRIAEEDIDDSLADVISVKQRDWATSYGKLIDNATLAVTAARGTHGGAFDSVYYLLSQADAGLGYVANSNIIKTAGSGAAVTYKNLSDVLSLLETGDYWDDANMVVFAHPYFRTVLRTILDDQKRPIFQESTNGTAGGGQGPAANLLFGLPLHFTLGAKTSTAPTSNPTGNPLIVVANRELLMLGKRSGPESIFIDGRSGLSALTDESILKMRARRAFALGHQKGAAVLEYAG